MKQEVKVQKSNSLIYEVFPVDPFDWNSILNITEHGPKQTHYYAMICKTKGHKATFYIISDGKNNYPVLAISRKRFLYTEVKIEDAGSDISQNIELLSLFVNFLENKYQSISFTTSCLTEVSINNMLEAYNRNNFHCNKWATYIIDLSQDIETIFSNLHSRCRKKIKKAVKLGCKLIFIADNLYVNYFLPYNKSENEVGRVSDFNLETSNAYEEFDFNNDMLYLKVEKGGKLLSTLAGIKYQEKHFTQMISTVSTYAFDNKIPAGDFITWELIKLAKKVGCTTYNLAGVNPNPKNTKEKNIKSFKKKWGGEYREYYIFEKKSMLVSLIDFAKKAILPYYIKYGVLFSNIINRKT